MGPRYVAAPDVASTRLDGEAVLLHLGTHRYYTLNETGCALWELLAEPRAAGELADALTAAYAVGAAEARAAAERLLAELLRDGLVTEAP